MNPQAGRGSKNRSRQTRKKVHYVLTFNFSDCVNQYVPLNFLILERGDDFVDDGLGKVCLFALFHLLFIAHPAVEDGFELSSNGDLLLLDVVL